MLAAARQKDQYNLPVSTVSPDARDHYVDGVERLLVGDTPAAITALEAAVRSDEGLLVAQATLGYALLQNGEKTQGNRHINIASGQGMTLLSAGERRHIAAIERATTPLDRHGVQQIELALGAYPHPVGARILFDHISGNPPLGHWDRLSRVLSPVLEATPNAWSVRADLAFCLQEMGLYDDAAALGEAVLSEHFASPGAHHAMVHVDTTRGEHVAALQRLDGWQDRHPKVAGRQAHIAGWHKALTHLFLGDVAAAWQTYRESVAPNANPTWSQLPDSSSFLWRLTLKGRQNVDWGMVMDRAEEAARHPGHPLTDLHVGLTFAANAPDRLPRLVKYWQSAKGRRHPAGEHVARVLDGLHDFAMGDAAAASRKLEAVFEPEFTLIGGSGLQRSVFFDTAVAATLLSGDRERSAEILKRQCDLPLPLPSIVAGQETAALQPALAI